MPEAPDAATDLGVLSSTGLWQAAGDGTSQHAFMLALEGAGPGRGVLKANPPNSGSQQILGSFYKPTWDRCDQSSNHGEGRERRNRRSLLMTRTAQEHEGGNCLGCL